MNSGSMPSAAPVAWVTMEQDGFTLMEILSSGTVREQAELSFTISDATGRPVTDFHASHGKLLHLIVVRADEPQFRHVHLTLNGRGAWSLPWEWSLAGNYRGSVLGPQVEGKIRIAEFVQKAPGVSKSPVDEPHRPSKYAGSTNHAGH